MTLETPEPGWCPPDRHEGVAGNDDADHAVWVSTRSVDTVLCPGDEDWFAVYLPAGSQLTARAVPGGDPDTVTMTLRIPGGQDERAAVEGAALVASVAVTAPTRVLISLSRDGGAIPIAVAVTWTASATDDCSVGQGDPEDCSACTTAAELTPGAPWQLPAAPPVDRLDVACGADDGPLERADRVAWFDLPVPATVSLELQGAREGLALELRPEDCRDGTRATACALAKGDEVALEYLELAPGRWFVVAEGGDALQPELLLTVQVDSSATRTPTAPPAYAQAVAVSPCARGTRTVAGRRPATPGVASSPTPAHGTKTAWG